MYDFRINDPGKDPGFGQSILHEAQLVFHTPPYNTHDVSIHDTAPIWTDVSHHGKSQATTMLKVGHTLSLIHI